MDNSVRRGLGLLALAVLALALAWLVKDGPIAVLTLFNLASWILGIAGLGFIAYGLLRPTASSPTSE